MLSDFSVRFIIPGLATAPVLFAAEEYPELNKLITRSFSKEGDVELAWEIVGNSTGLEKTRTAAREHAEHAVKMVLTTCCRLTYFL